MKKAVIFLLIFGFSLFPAFLISRAMAGTNQLFEEYGVGPRDTALGNAFTAIADDYSAAFYNPAGFAFSQGHHIHMGYRGIYPATYIRFHPDNGRNLGLAPNTDLFLFGFSTDLDFKEMINERVSDRLGLGLAVGVGRYIKSFTLYSDPNTPYMFRYSDRPVSLLSLYSGFAVKIFDWFSVGASVCAAPSETYTDVIAHTDIYIPSMQWETTQGQSTLAWSKIEPVIGTQFRVPMMGRPDYLRFALVWRDEVITVDGSGEVTNVNRIILEKTGEMYQLPLTTVLLHQLSGYSPASITLGANWQPTANINVVVDGIWKQWSKWLDGDESRPDPPLRDTIQVRTGYEHKIPIDWAWISDLIVRGGYYYEPSPVQDMNGPMNILDPNKHVSSIGTGFIFNDPMGWILTPMKFDAAYQIHWLIEEKLDNDRDPVYGPLEAGGQMHTFAATFELQF